MRKVALQKFQQASKQTEQVADTYDDTHSYMHLNNFYLMLQLDICLVMFHSFYGVWWDIAVIVLFIYLLRLMKPSLNNFKEVFNLSY